VTKLLIEATQLKGLYLLEAMDELIKLRDKVAEAERELQDALRHAAVGVLPVQSRAVH
jgi:hypothetical protein